MEIESIHHTASEIATEAEVESIESYEGRIHHYKNQNYTYIPIPSSMKYYNTKEGWLRDIANEQIIIDDTHLVEVLRRMQNQPFLLLDYQLNTFVIHRKGGEDPIQYHIGTTDEKMSKDEVNEFIDWGHFDLHQDDAIISRFEEYLDKFGPIASGHGESDRRYGIITLADLNKREMKDMLYRLFGELVSELGGKIEHEYPEPDSILKHIRADAIGRWKKDQIQGLDLHIAEHINLIDMHQIIQASDRNFVNTCGFDSKQDVDTLRKINDVRNAVMHANRSLIHNRHDIGEVLETIEEAERITQNLEQDICW